MRRPLQRGEGSSPTVANMTISLFFSCNWSYSSTSGTSLASTGTPCSPRSQAQAQSRTCSVLFRAETLWESFEGPGLKQKTKINRRRDKESSTAYILSSILLLVCTHHVLKYDTSHIFVNIRQKIIKIGAKNIKFDRNNSNIYNKSKRKCQIFR